MGNTVRYWVGAPGNWSNPANWSASLNMRQVAARLIIHVGSAGIEVEVRG